MLFDRVALSATPINPSHFLAISGLIWAISGLILAILSLILAFLGLILTIYKVSERVGGTYII